MRNSALLPKTVVFDLGAVLLHWQPTDIIQLELPQHAPNASTAQALCDSIFQGLRPGTTWAKFDRGTVEPAPLAALLGAQSGVDTADMLRFIRAIPDHLQTQHDTAALLPRLRRRHARRLRLHPVRHRLPSRPA